MTRSLWDIFTPWQPPRRPIHLAETRSADDAQRAGIGNREAGSERTGAPLTAPSSTRLYVAHAAGRLTLRTQAEEDARLERLREQMSNASKCRKAGAARDADAHCSTDTTSTTS